MSSSTKSSMFATSSITHFLATILIILSLCSTYQFVVLVATPIPNREALEIVIGGGSTSPTPEYSPGCGTCTSPPPPETPCPPPPSQPSSPSPGPENEVQIATRVIKQFFQRIDSDSCGLKMLKNIKNPKFCDNSKFNCAFLNAKNQNALYGVQFNGCMIKGKNLTLEDFINKLPEVSVFHANSNNFNGKIPNLSHLPYLFELDLSNNKYEGKFPSNVLTATQLTYLDLRFNSFVGPIPAQLFDLQVLALFINNNNFEQDLPSNLGSTPAAFLTFANNKFTGPIPKSIKQASNTLLEVLFLNNHLSGCLPYEIGYLKKARVFDVSTNYLTGPIPRSFGCLEKMQNLVMANNEFFGAVPEEVCMLPHLKQLSLCNNYFTQVGPECMKLVHKGVLDVTNNCILGLPNQKSKEMCASFFKRPKTCGEEKSLTIVPCKNTAGYLNGEVLLEGAPQSHPTVTYGALTPNN